MMSTPPASSMLSLAYRDPWAEALPRRSMGRPRNTDDSPGPIPPELPGHITTPHAGRDPPSYSIAGTGPASEGMDTSTPEPGGAALEVGMARRARARRECHNLSSFPPPRDRKSSSPRRVGQARLHPPACLLVSSPSRTGTSRKTLKVLGHRRRSRRAPSSRTSACGEREGWLPTISACASGTWGPWPGA